MEESEENKSISETVAKAARQMIEQTEDFVLSVKDKVLEENIITIMINGKEIKLNKSDYELLKKQNEKIKSQMKKEIQDIITFKKLKTLNI